MRFVTLSVLMFVSAGCSARLTREGAMVREGSVVLRDVCQFLGIVEASDTSARVLAATAGGAGGAGGNPQVGDNIDGSKTELRTEIRNKVAEMNGNMFVIVAAGRFDVQGEAYRCAPASED